MISKTELDKKINDLIKEIGGEFNFTNVHLLFVSKKLRNILNETTKLQEELHAVQDNTAEFLEIHGRFCEIDSKHSSLIKTLNIVSHGFLPYIGILVGFCLMTNYGVPLIKKYFEIEIPEKILSFGLAGAFLYIILWYEKTQKLTLLTMLTMRILIAIVAPIVLVPLLFTKEGQIIDGFQITPAFFSFVCGYSSTLVVEILNNLTKKILKVIEVL